MADVGGARFTELVEVMARLRRDCPWDREQTHASLAPYLLEESYEVIDAVEGGELDALAEELGDVLMQVVFHSVVAAERDAFTIDDVVGAIVDKLKRRHPHVFGSVKVAGPDEVNANWEKIKEAERAAKGTGASIVDGVAMAAPALALTAQLQRRGERVGAPAELDPADGLGAELFELVRRARATGLDPEAELRATARQYRDRLRSWDTHSV
jgi:XTP/dITP diphosphohydrolase